MFFCGSPHLGSVIRQKCLQHGFDFRIEKFWIIVAVTDVTVLCWRLSSIIRATSYNGSEDILFVEAPFVSSKMGPNRVMQKYSSTEMGCLMSLHYYKTFPVWVVCVIVIHEYEIDYWYRQRSRVAMAYLSSRALHGLVIPGSWVQTPWEPACCVLKNIHFWMHWKVLLPNFSFLRWSNG